MLLRHEAGARAVAQYDANNTYQYIINREDTQLSWLSAAITSLGGASRDRSAPEPARVEASRGRDAWRSLAEGHARDAQAFVDRWRPRVEAMTNARHRGMLRVILGEMLEQKRFFEQAPPATSICSAAVPMPSGRVSARCCRRDGSSKPNRGNRVIGVIG